MKKIHIFNPASGKSKLVPKNIKDDLYQTKCTGDAKEYAHNICKHQDVHFVVHGGDGTINEVASGIIKAEDPYAMVEEMLYNLRKAWDELNG